MKSGGYELWGSGSETSHTRLPFSLGGRSAGTQHGSVKAMDGAMGLCTGLETGGRTVVSGAASLVSISRLRTPMNYEMLVSLSKALHAIRLGD